MIRLMLALAGSTVAGLIVSVIVLVRSHTSVHSADALGFLAVTLALAWLLGLFVYAPVGWLVRRRGVRHPALGAVTIGLVVNVPLFAALVIMDRVGGFFAPGEAFTIAVLAIAIGAVHGAIAFRPKRVAAELAPVAEPDPVAGRTS